METSKNDHWYIRGKKGCAELIKQELLKRGADDPLFETTKYDVEGLLYHLLCGIVRVTVDDSLVGKRIIANWEEVKVEKPKSKPQFKPYNRVLGCDGEGRVWHIDWYEDYIENSDFPHKCMVCSYKYCLPYKGNEHLVGAGFKPEHVKGV